MRHLPVILFCAGSVFAPAGAQAAVYDTSILKNGNTWVYSVDVEHRDVSTVEDGLQVVRTFSLDSLLFSGDSTHFRVVMRDSGTQYGVLGTDTIMVNSQPVPLIHLGYGPVNSTQSAWYTFRANGFSPAVPLFFKAQMFTGSEPKVLYHGDTLERTLSSYSGCAPFTRENLKSVGLTRDESSYACGITSGHDYYRLLSFNGVAYGPNEVYPVALMTPLFQAGRKQAVPGMFQGGSVIYGRGSRAFDTKGRVYNARGRKPPLSETGKTP